MTCPMGCLDAAIKSKKTSVTIGIDLGYRKHAICVVDAKGGVIKEESIRSKRSGLTALSRRYPKALMGMEVGMHSPWKSRLLKDLWHRELVANPRKVSAIHRNIRKSDRIDAGCSRVPPAEGGIIRPFASSSEVLRVPHDSTRSRPGKLSGPTLKAREGGGRHAGEFGFPEGSGSNFARQVVA